MPSARELSERYDFFHGAAPLPDEVRQALVRRKQQIGQVELLGAVAPYLSLPELLRGRDVIHFVDNTSAVAALTKGYLFARARLCAHRACIPCVVCRCTYAHVV